MNPQISNINENGDVYQFTLSNINVSLANSIRRVILSRIPTLVFYTENHETNKCNIEINTSRLHNEIVKHRLACIPIHSKELDILPNKYVLEVDVVNDTDNIIYVTTEDFKIKHKESGQYLTKEETRKIFPKNPITNYYIDFVRLRPKISDTIVGEHLKLSCEFSVACAEINNMYNVVSKCTYSNTPDIVRIGEIWEAAENKLRAENNSKEEIEFHKKNFYLLDAQRYFVPNSFDFTIQTIGVYENREIVKKACAILQNYFTDMSQSIDGDNIPIVKSETTIEHSYDIILEGEDYTVGKVLEYILYEKYYIEEKILSFCGFKKFHPHDSHSVVRIAYNESTDKTVLRSHLKFACISAQEIYASLYKMF